MFYRPTYAYMVDDLKTISIFHNLTRMELTFNHSSRDMRKCRSFFKILPYFLTLQHFNIWLMFFNYLGELYICFECLKVPPNPTIAPECSPSHLITFCIKGYTRREYEFKFVKYIMKHSKKH